MRTFSDLVKGGPYIGKRGGKWADPQHKIPWKEDKHGGKPAPTAKDHDDHGAQDLQLTIENDHKHYGQLESIRDNLVRKIASGKYDHAQASKLFQYLTDAGSKQYKKDHGSAGGSGGHAFDVATRQAAAREMAHEFHEEVKSGDHDHRLSGVNKKRAEAGGGLAKMAEGHTPDHHTTDHKLSDDHHDTLTQIHEGKGPGGSKDFEGAKKAGHIRKDANGNTKLTKKGKEAVANHHMEQRYNKLKNGGSMQGSSISKQEYMDANRKAVLNNMKNGSVPDGRGKYTHSRSSHKFDPKHPNVEKSMTFGDVVRKAR